MHSSKKELKRARKRHQAYLRHFPNASDREKRIAHMAELERLHNETSQESKPLTTRETIIYAACLITALLAALAVYLTFA